MDIGALTDDRVPVQDYVEELFSAEVRKERQLVLEGQGGGLDISFSTEQPDHYLFGSLVGDADNDTLFYGDDTESGFGSTTVEEELLMGIPESGPVSPRKGRRASLDVDQVERVDTDEAAFEAAGLTFSKTDWFVVEHLASVPIKLKKGKEEPGVDEGLWYVKEYGGMWTQNMELNISAKGIRMRDPDSNNDEIRTYV